MTRIFNNSRIEVLSSAQINKLEDDGRHLIQVMPGTTPGYFLVEHVDKEALLKGECLPYGKN